MSKLPLSALRTRGTITDINPKHAKRLYPFGIIPNARITYRFHNASLYAYQIAGTLFALRKELANAVTVQEVETN